MSIEAFERLPEEKREKILSAGIRTFASSPFAEAGTDAITEESHISKGLLFHYFGSKRAFYLYCLDVSLSRLTAATPVISKGGFFDVLFAMLDEKFRVCRDHPWETRMVNMASRDPGGGLAAEKAAVLLKYKGALQSGSDHTLLRAMAALPLKAPGDMAVLAALRLYIGALINRYLVMYRETPERFFENADHVKQELRRDIGFILNGICREDTIK